MRFEEVYSQSSPVRVEIIVDTQTGVQYLKCGDSITPLLEYTGSPVTGRNRYV